MSVVYGNSFLAPSLNGVISVLVHTFKMGNTDLEPSVGKWSKKFGWLFLRLLPPFPDPREPAWRNSGFKFDRE